MVFEIKILRENIWNSRHLRISCSMQRMQYLPIPNELLYLIIQIKQLSNLTDKMNRIYKIYSDKI